MARKTRLEAFDEMLADRAFAKKLDDESDFVPPGFQRITTVRDELGARELRERLSAGRMKAYLWARDGSVEPCATKFWLSDQAEAAIVTGGYQTWRLLLPVQEAGKEVLAEKLSQKAVYLSPFMELMIEASQHFDLGSPAGKRVSKQTVVDWFLKKGLPDGTPLSNHLAENMSTLCRHPSSLRGGMKRGKWE